MHRAPARAERGGNRELVVPLQTPPAMTGGSGKTAPAKPRRGSSGLGLQRPKRCVRPWANGWPTRQAAMRPQFPAQSRWQTRQYGQQIYHPARKEFRKSRSCLIAFRRFNRFHQGEPFCLLAWHGDKVLRDLAAGACEQCLGCFISNQFTQ